MPIKKGRSVIPLHMDTMEKLFLKAGELLFTNKPFKVMTILGSCVAVTMFHKKTHISAMCHVLLPQCAKDKRCDSERCREPFKYAHCAISEMLNKYHGLLIPRQEIEVKLFGGASGFNGSQRKEREKSVGAQNVRMAAGVLMQRGLLIKVADVRGERGRKIIFNTQNGTVLLKHIDKMLFAEKAPLLPVEKEIVLRNIRHLRDFQLD